MPILIVALFSSTVIFTVTYFFREQANKGYVKFAPGIYLQFDDVELIDNSVDFNMLYYKNGNFENEPVIFDTSSELATPNKEYYVLSPKFKAALPTIEDFEEDEVESTSFYARFSLKYTDNDGVEYSQEVMDYLFSRDNSFSEDEKGVLLEASDDWAFKDGYYYYTGLAGISNITKQDLQLISYDENAQYIKLFTTTIDSESGIEYCKFKLANQTTENYEQEIIKIQIKMEFIQQNSPELNVWLGE